MPQQITGQTEQRTTLQPGVVQLWLISHAISWTVLLTIGLLVLRLFLGHYPLLLRLSIALWAAALPLTVVLAYWYAHRLYDSWWFRLDHEVLETHRGVLTVITQYVPLPRLQHVDVQRGPIERYLGLATLVLHTAGVGQATVVIPGLDAGHAFALRDYLVALGVARR